MFLKSIQKGNISLHIDHDIYQDDLPLAISMLTEITNDAVCLNTPTENQKSCDHCQMSKESEEGIPLHCLPVRFVES